MRYRQHGITRLANKGLRSWCVGMIMSSHPLGSGAWKANTGARGNQRIDCQRFSHQLQTFKKEEKKKDHLRGGQAHRLKHGLGREYTVGNIFPAVVALGCRLLGPLINMLI